jgi:protein MPE1
MQGGPSQNANVTEAARPNDAGRRAPMHRGQMTMRFDGRDGAPGTGSNSTPTPAPVAALSNLEQTDDDEAARIAAMFQATTEQWDETQERMANATYRERGGAPRRGGPPRPPPTNTHQAAYAPTPDRPPPTGYICFRCGTKGHWIHDCPTNNDRDFDNKPRYKRTTGIPKSMLKTIEAPTDEMRREGVMVTPDGSYVVAQVDSASWARSQALRNKPLTKSDIYSSVPSDTKLACSLCNKLLRDAVRTPCCSTLFCQECIVNYLLEHDFQCSECEKRIKDLGTLKRDEEVQKQVREYIDAEIDKSEKKIQEVEKAERDEVEKAQREKEEEERASKGIPAEETKEEGGEDGDVVKKEGEGEDDQPKDPDVGNEGNNGMQNAGWNPAAVQQIMTMLCNPQLPPPMRMQLQMQLQFMQNQFMQTMMQQQSNGGQQQQQQAQFQQPSVNPYAGQHQMGMGYMGMFPAQQAAVPTSVPFRPAAPLSHQESAYMRLPINPNNRNRTGVKRERPQDFTELG